MNLSDEDGVLDESQSGGRLHLSGITAERDVGKKKIEEDYALIAADHGLFCYKVFNRNHYGDEVILCVHNPVTDFSKRIIVPYSFEEGMVDRSSDSVLGNGSNRDRQLCRDTRSALDRMSVIQALKLWLWVTLLTFRRVLGHVVDVVEQHQHEAVGNREYNRQVDEAVYSDSSDESVRTAEAEGLSDNNSTTEDSMVTTGNREEPGQQELESNASMIPALPDDVTRYSVWPNLRSTEQPDPTLLWQLRLISHEWRRFIEETPEWCALEVVRITNERYRQETVGRPMTVAERMRIELSAIEE
ncbi:hypothetical protein R1sor_016460 [Riccia sorocarpa]|uniref:F-box domain-containing protein n=1 Tax=Riccia sorocarpa TaxID=122646 RepID=A0ABD3HGX3_9MARC